MKIGYRIATGTDESQIRALLEQAQLPTESLGTNVTEFFVAEQDGAIVGAAGFEYYGDDALLRSLAIQANQRNLGLGSSLVDWMLSRAIELRIKRIVLLTDTACKFFQKRGFQVVSRSFITNDAMKKSSEFASVCPASSTTMILNLT
ncbi:MAG: arsenic resistance N-acetyltransferase ArsN2 [Ignavibacteriales bacterium]|nr:arsenic resistance N-acetyltransferase ArsN2 [Ignavibacteriales bacterium]